MSLLTPRVLKFAVKIENRINVGKREYFDCHVVVYIVYSNVNVVVSLKFSALCARTLPVRWTIAAAPRDRLEGTSSSNQTNTA